MIELVLEHYGATVPRSHGRFTMRCPFHDDHYNSASVDLERDLFNCFVCMWGGDWIEVIMKQEGVGYRDAIAFAEETLGASGDVVLSHADPGGYGVSRGKGNRQRNRRKLPSWKRR